MVLDSGRIVSVQICHSFLVLSPHVQVEFDKPSELLKIREGFLRKLVDESNDREKLHTMASESGRIML